MKISDPPKTSMQPYVEDAPENGDMAIALVAPPPRAPSPPPSAGAAVGKPINVFDFLVNEETPNASRISVNIPQEQMQMVANAKPLFKSRTPTPDIEVDWEFDDSFEYGAAPVPTKDHVEYRTPAAKAITSGHKPKQASTDKKRKRQVEELDLTQARRSSQELDEEMPDIDENGRPMLHTGLTGGLNRMIARFPPSPEYSGGSGQEPSPLSPAKRKYATAKGVIIEKRGRATHGQLVKIRKPRRSSDESRPRKHHRSHKNQDLDRPKRAMKAIEYHRTASPHVNDANQLVVYQSRAEMFLSFVTKGPDSEHGYSLNKALKRYHRERGDHGLDKQEAEKELFKLLRLKKNERGEVVVLIGEER